MHQHRNDLNVDIENNLGFVGGQPDQRIDSLTAHLPIIRFVIITPQHQ
jgi:hypothetical protein